MIIGLDIGTNYTKATKDGKNVVMFPSLVAYGEEKDWSLKGESKKVYIGDEAFYVSQTMENVEVLRPLHEGRIMHQSFVEIAKYAVKKLEAVNGVIATGLPVKSSKKEREAVVSSLKNALNTDVLVFPQPVGSLTYMGYTTGVCIDIGFGTTDVIVLFDMEYLKGDTMLVGVDNIYNNLEVAIRNKLGISITPEEMSKLLLNKDYEVGKIRSGKRIVVRQEDVLNEYNEIVKGWADRIANRVKILLEGLSTTIVDKIVLTGGGSLLPGVYEEFVGHFSDIAKVEKPDDPLTANTKGFYKLAKILVGEKETEEKARTEENVETAEQAEVGQEVDKKEKKGKKK
jgi:rod shape-determining protein MreB